MPTVPPITYSPKDIKDAAMYACVRVLPRSQRDPYVNDNLRKYKADLVVSILQGISHLMTGIFIGLLSSYLYDKTKSKEPARDSVALKRALRRQRGELRKLKRLIESRRGFAGARRRYEAYEELLTKIEKSDPSITKAIEDAIKQLERRGAESLRGGVDSKLRGK